MVPEQQRPFTVLAQLMVPFSRIARAEPDEALAPVLARATPSTSYITVWRDGRLVGVVDARGAAAATADHPRRLTARAWRSRPRPPTAVVIAATVGAGRRDVRQA